MGDPLKILLYILLSSVKFAAGPPFAYYSNTYDFTYLEIILYSITGGMFGVFVFTFFSSKILELWQWIIWRMKKTVRRKGVFSEPSPDIEFKGVIRYTMAGENIRKKVFTKKNRRIVKLWKKYGEFGVAFLTPIILSIPLGTFIATRYRTVSNKKCIPYSFFNIR